ncbi:hypothetical protein FAES_5197 [Fibrella aestuarina BUZ 2]|uniref:DUF308 domain-containing protein n=1 Tax=Fibrella aestuarina BUZ 2 TaxID=1166018 RepID=I0KGE3_9BACT|nr:DUF308 domain-containing protein [Fibrella aestuarina]CCH03196.1 hypothetical protein FAES_5197 [Fibrella aestuarina BUZ 2]
MNNQQQMQQRWLLIARGIGYILLGVGLFVYANTFTPAIGRTIGIITILAGLTGSAYARINSRVDPNNFWIILHGLNDTIFGIVFLITATQGLKNFVDMLGFWALVYAFLQAVRSMYAALMEGGASLYNLVNKLTHFASVLLAGYLAFDILMRPIGFVQSLGIMGFFPIGLGILVILRTRLNDEKTVTIAENRLK